MTPGVPWPSDAAARTRWYEEKVDAPPSSVLMVREISADAWGSEPANLVPPAALELAERTEGARMLLSVAKDKTRLGLSIWLSVQWRPAGRPPTIMALWRNGKRDHVMIGWRKVSHTEAGIVRSGSIGDEG